MQWTSVAASWTRREERVAAFESARAEDDSVDLAEFLPPHGDGDRLPVLSELVRIDLELRAARGAAPRLSEYLERFPELASDRNRLQEIAYEEYRIRRQAGELVSPEEYQALTGVSVGQWPVMDAGTNVLQPDQQASLDRAGQSLQRQLLSGPDEHAGILDDWRAADPASAAKMADGLAQLPAIGRQFLDFELIQELGQGAFARVFLARQAGLARRLVALKVSADLRGEAQVLARLQHTNIVPIYSVHRQGALQAVCMPYFGGATLGHLLRSLHGQKTPPSSGLSLVQTLRAYKSETVEQESRAAAAGPIASAAAQSPPAATLDMLERLSFVDAVLWLAARMADGLAHAHERGILHSDLKPANVLVADDGQPMLLDFNLSIDCNNLVEARKAAAGGTLPYMAPEHLRLFHDRSGQIDARADIYSLGVILHEMLTGHHPFPPARGGQMKELLPAMIEARQSPPAPRRQNRAISPAVDAIVCRCLAPDPAKRYQSAAALREDIERHRADLPLRHVPNPSVWERLLKWKRRHPRLTSATSIVAVAAVVILSLASLLVVHGERLAKFEAVQSWQEFEKDSRAAQIGVYARVGEPKELARGLEACRQALGRYKVLEDARWSDQPAVVQLPDEDRTQLVEHVADLLVLQARGLLQNLAVDAPPRAKEATIHEAIALNERAAACFSEAAVPRVVWEQRAQLLEMLGRGAEALQFQEKASKLPRRSAQEWYWSGVDHFLAGQPGEARPPLEAALERDPKHLRAWFVLGRCNDAVGKDSEAIGCYNACIALSPEFPWAYFNRGLAYLRLQQYPAALADFSRTLELRPDLADACINRALAHQGLQEYAQAAADLTRALDLGAAQTRIYFMRARVWDKCGENAKAKADRDKGLALEPSDEKSWIARGLARLPADARGALADFDQALVLNPLSTDALQNKAHVLTEHLPAPTEADKLRQTQEAIAVLDKALHIRPDYVPARSGRGVLLARLGEREPALADAREVLRRDSSPRTIYEVACVYALTAKENPDDKLEAFRLLATALRQGFGHEFIETDDDLLALRSSPEFTRLVEAARALKKN
jgi:eukaryotic-like serine/threonine-protein kinase